jgi:hypothetical protein
MSQIDSIVHDILKTGLLGIVVLISCRYGRHNRRISSSGLANTAGSSRFLLSPGSAQARHYA